jgi:hypothetical protein
VSRRRRRQRRDRVDRTAPRTEKRASREEDRRREAFEKERASLMRRRRFVGALAFVPLLGPAACYIGIGPACQVPSEWWLAIFAALFGSYLGITIRLFLERRRFLRQAAARTS